MNEPLARLRDGRYTGENRCTKCTLFNAWLGLVVASAVAVVDRVLGATLLLLFLVVLYFRGYLVPGTPRLTKRYLPGSLAAWFKPGGAERDAGTDVSVETILEAAGVFTREEPLPTDGDEAAATGSELDPVFRRQWQDRIERARTESANSALLGQIGGFRSLSTQDVRTAETGHAFVVSVNDIDVGRWESRGAYLADVGAAELLRDRYAGWNELSFDERTTVLGALRMWLEDCPLCEGHVSLNEATVESCCRIVDVIAGTCDECGRRMFEVDAP